MPRSVEATPFLGHWLAENWQLYLGEPRALGEVVQFLSGEHIGNISRWVLATGRGAFDLLLFVLFMMITLFFVYKTGPSLSDSSTASANARCLLAGIASRASCRRP